MKGSVVDGEGGRDSIVRLDSRLIMSAMGRVAGTKIRFKVR